MIDRYSTNVQAAAYLARMEQDWDRDDDRPAADEWQEGAPWLGDPWYFDVRCANCGHEYLNTIGICPVCDHDEVTPVGI